MLRATYRLGDRRLRHHAMLDGQINPREWFNWHPKEFQPWYYDRHRWLYEQHQYHHVHHLLCQQVYLKDMVQLMKCPEPTTVIIDCRMSTEKMHRWIPHSKWIPRDEVDYALQLTAEEFLELYGFEQPVRSQNIICVSHNGLASEQAGWEFKKQYYPSVWNFRGGCNDLFGEKYADFPPPGKLAPWKGPFPQNGLYVDNWSKRKVLTRVGPFDRQYELDEFALPDLELESKRHPEDGPRSHMPWGLQ
jgi:hypothetical protein